MISNSIFIALRKAGAFILLLLLLAVISIFPNSCAQIGATTGGPRDSIAPVLVRSSPQPRTTSFDGKKITLVFDEYITLKEPQNNILISPFQQNQPMVTSNLKTVSIKLKDSLRPNTTYNIQFGDAIEDINEGNALKDFSYVFSTGTYIDSMTLKGKVLLAETGQVDSTVSVMLYSNLQDTAVQKLKPDFIARVRGDGSFLFKNLPPGRFNLYALKDGDGNKSYNIKTEIFAFLDSPVTTDSSQPAIELLAYAAEPANEKKSFNVLRPALEKTLRYQAGTGGTQDLLDSFVLKFNNPLKLIDTAQIVLRDTNFIPVPKGAPFIDSTRKIIAYAPAWMEGSAYTILITKETFEDSAGHKLAKADTIRITAKEPKDYGRLVLRFKNYEQAKHPVLQLLSGVDIKYSFPLAAAEWKNDLILPGEYEMRILYDDNQDGKWTPGDYGKKRQPEQAITLPQKLSIRADWDNERDITL